MSDTPRTDAREIEHRERFASINQEVYGMVDAGFARELEREAEAFRGALTAGPDKVLRCAFCGEAYPEGTPDHKHETLAAHIRVCEKHPVGIENTNLRRALEEICTDAHCIAKAGPLSVPTLDVAWNRFMAISARAASALHRPQAGALMDAVTEAQKHNHEKTLRLDEDLERDRASHRADPVPEVDAE